MSRLFSFRRLVSAIVALAVLGLAVPVIAGEVPFKGRAEVVITDAEPAESELHLTTSGSGLATHLGRFTREEHAVLHLDDGSFLGTVTFIAANGDELYADIDGAFISPSTALATYTFTGGTGRFANATGSANVVAVTSDSIHIAITFEGTIEF
jgi:hypothetical protein